MTSKTLNTGMLVLTLACAHAQEVTIGGPALGWELDGRARMIRPILGIPGAATLGDAPELDAELIRVSVAPGLPYALAEKRDDTSLYFVRSLEDRVSMEPVAGAVSGADAIVFSASGAAAVLLFRTEARVVILTGFPAKPSVAREFDLSQLQGKISALAVSEDGTLVVAGASEEERGAVYALFAGGPIRYLLPARDPSAIALLNSPAGALVADRAANAVYLVRDIAGPAQVLTVVSESDGIQAPSAVGISADGRRAFVANASGIITAVGLEDGTLTTAECECRPQSLARLGASAVFRLEGGTESPILLLDASGPAPRVVFVPAREAASARASSSRKGRRP